VVDAVLNQSASVCDISNRLGFTEPANFTRFFRSHAGVSPREFRNAPPARELMVHRKKRQRNEVGW
jgi:AraC-like DNA-binding protein